MWTVLGALRSRFSCPNAWTNKRTPHLRGISSTEFESSVFSFPYFLRCEYRLVFSSPTAWAKKYERTFAVFQGLSSESSILGCPYYMRCEYRLALLRNLMSDPYRNSWKQTNVVVPFRFQRMTAGDPSVSTWASHHFSSGYLATVPF